MDSLRPKIGDVSDRAKEKLTIAKYQVCIFVAMGRCQHHRNGPTYKGM